MPSASRAAQYTGSFGAPSRAQALIPRIKFFCLRKPALARSSTARAERPATLRCREGLPGRVSTRGQVPLHLLELFLGDLALGVPAFQDIQG